MRQVKLRPRRYSRVVRKGEPPDKIRHGHHSEYEMHAISILCNIAFVFGSACFLSVFPDEWGPKVGAHCFLGGALVMGFTSAIGVLEHHAHLKESARYRDAALYNQIKLMFEELCYALGSAAFVIGSIFFEPRFENTLSSEKEEARFAQWGTTMFIVGSMFYVLASYLNALSIAHEGLLTKNAEADAVGWVGRATLQVSLFAVQLGSVFFFAGSFLYQGKLDACFTGMAPRLPLDQGSLLYIAGSACYLLQSLLSLADTLRRHGAEDATASSRVVKVTTAGV